MLRLSLVIGDWLLVIGGKPSSAERSRTSSVSREDAPGDRLLVNGDCVSVVLRLYL